MHDVFSGFRTFQRSILICYVFLEKKRVLKKLWEKKHHFQNQTFIRQGGFSCVLVLNVNERLIKILLPSKNYTFLKSFRGISSAG